MLLVCSRVERIGGDESRREKREGREEELGKRMREWKTTKENGITEGDQDNLRKRERGRKRDEHEQKGKWYNVSLCHHHWERGERRGSTHHDHHLFLQDLNS